MRQNFILLIGENNSTPMSAPTAAMGWKEYWQAMDGTAVFTDAGTTPATNGGLAYQLSGSLGVVANSMFRQTTEGNRPTFATGGAGGKSYLSFDGIDNYMETIAGQAASLFLAVGAKTIIIACGITTTSNNYGVMGDTTSQYQGINIYTGPKLQYYNYSGGNTFSTGQSFTGGTTPFVYTVKHDTGKLYDRKNGGAWSTGVDSGNTGALSRLLAIGKQSTSYVNMRFYAACMAASVISDANITLVENYLMNQLGL